MSVHWEILQLQQTFSLDCQPERGREREGDQDFVLLKVV